MTRLLITNQVCMLNKGDEALLKCTLALLRRFARSPKITVLSSNPAIDRKLLSEEDVKIKKTPSGYLRIASCLIRVLLYRLLGAFSPRIGKKILGKTVLLDYVGADAVIVRGGDTFTSDYGTPSLFAHVALVLFSLLLRKRTVLLGHSIGPFRKRIDLWLATCVLRRVDAIVVREEISQSYLQSIGISDNVHLSTDVAFLLESSSSERVEGILGQYGISPSEEYVGISVSRLISRYGFPDEPSQQVKYEKYLEIMCQLIEFLRSEFEAKILLVPHVFGPGSNDDRIPIREILRRLDSPSYLRYLEVPYTAEEIKGIIARCRIFIGARMHATIASTSSGVPTIALAYSDKYHGVIGQALEMAEWVVDIRDFSSSEFGQVVRRKVEELIEKETEIREALKISVPKLRTSLIAAGEIVKGLLETDDRGFHNGLASED